ncbi:MAG: PD-(D/E)XK nuclease family protein [Smithella sp.]|jgi:hypothetical protein
MPTPHKGYFTKDGKKVPGTTTIIGRFKESGGLIQWAYNRGKEGLELYESRDKASELGTIVHDMVENFIRGTLAPMPELNEIDHKAVVSAYEAFQEWFDSNKFKVVAQEIQLVSEIHLYGGTPDAIAMDGKGRLCLLDWKTSNGVYQDYLFQLGAYRMLWNENNPDNQLTGGSHLCRFAKENGDFAHHFYPNIDEAERGFLLMRGLYDIDKGLRARC